MLKLFNKEHVAIGALTDLKDYKIEYLLSGEDLVEFSLSISDENIHLVEEEGYIRNKLNEYVIKAIDPSQNFKRFSCVVNIESIKGKSIANFDTSNNNITDTIRLAIAGTGWILADNNITKRRTVRLKNTNALEVLREVRKVFRVDFRFDAINKIIHVYESFGSDKGVYFSDELNLRSLDIPSDTYDYATRLYAYGKDGLNIASINGGKEYVENFQYSNKVIEHIWEDNRYTDINSLKTDAEAKLEELSKPKRSYQASISDLAKQSKEYEFLDFFLGDTITLLSKQEKFRDKQRIVKYIQYPNNPSSNTCELGNTQLTFEDLQKENEAKNNIVDNITSDNGTIDGSKVDNITTDQISDFEASVGKITDLTVVNAKIENLEATNVTITGKLTAIEGEFGTLKANVGVIDNLTVTHTAQINDLKANSATITQLEAVNAKIGTVEAEVGKIQTLVNGNLSSENIQAGGITSDSLTIKNGFITNAMIANLDVSKVNAGDISTNKFKIKSDDGGIEIVGATQQFKDKNNRVRIQMGKDTQGNFNFIIRGEDGTTTLIDHTGVKSKAIADNLIVDNMIATDAVGEKQINYSSFATGFNKDTNTSTIKSTKIHLNNQNQTLEVAFNSLKTQADGTKSLTESHSTTIGVMQGQITTAINNTQIVKDGQTILLKDDYNRTVATVDSMKSTIGSHTTTINEHTGKITGVETKVNTVERDLNSITARVSSTESSTTTLTTQMGQVDGKINTAKDKAIVDSRTLKDTRNTNENPQWYFTNYPRQTIVEFKTFKILGISSSSSYGTLTTNVPWNDSSGGYPVQTFRSNSGGTYERKGSSTTAWGSWQQVEDTNGSQSKANNALNDAKLYTTTEITKTNNKVSSIETNLSSITSRVSTVETKQTTTDGKVTALETWKREAEVKITDSAIISTVSSQFYNKGQTDSKYATQSTLTQLDNKFEFNFKNGGGYNLLMNGGFENGVEFWGASNSPILDPDNPYLRLDGMTLLVRYNAVGSGIYQVFNTIKGKDYSYSCYVFNEGEMYVGIEDMKYTQAVVGGWQYLTGTFTATSDKHSFVAYSKNNNGSFYIDNICVNEGLPKKYTPNPNEIYKGSTKIDMNGITINNGAITIKNKTGETVFNGDVEGNLIYRGIMKQELTNGNFVMLQPIQVGNEIQYKMILNGSGIDTNFNVTDGRGVELFRVGHGGIGLNEYVTFGTAQSGEHNTICYWENGTYRPAIANKALIGTNTHYMNSVFSRYLGMDRGMDTYTTLEAGNVSIRTMFNSGDNDNGIMFGYNGRVYPASNIAWSLGMPSNRWNILYCNSIDYPSDLRLKENVRYLKTSSLAKSKTMKSNSELSIDDCYNFIKDDLLVAEFNYKTHKCREDEKFDSIGFIAQDIEGTKVGDKILKLNEGYLSYDNASLQGVTMSALQKAIEKIEKLEKEIEILMAR